VHVRLFAVMLLLVAVAVVMAVRELTVVVLVDMPVRAVLPLRDPARMVVGDVVVIMAMHHRRVGVRVLKVPMDLAVRRASTGIGPPVLKLGYHRVPSVVTLVPYRCIQHTPSGVAGHRMKHLMPAHPSCATVEIGVVRRRGA
jgi:hypothetical protein